jgi:glycosyltransferase involved in cell wall biosynthesis
MPKVSVIIITWDSRNVLSLFLNKLEKQTLKDFEVLIIDNGSSDGSLDKLETRWPDLGIHVERFDNNRSFAQFRRFSCPRLSEATTASGKTQSRICVLSLTPDAG